MATDPLFPIELHNLTGIGKHILMERRNLYRIGLIHSDDEPSKRGHSFLQQMTDLQRLAVRTLG